MDCFVGGDFTNLGREMVLYFQNGKFNVFDASTGNFSTPKLVVTKLMQQQKNSNNLINGTKYVRQKTRDSHLFRIYFLKVKN